MTDNSDGPSPQNPAPLGIHKAPDEPSAGIGHLNHLAMFALPPEFADVVRNLLTKDFVRDASPKEVELARRLGALPIGIDLGSYIFLTAEGDCILVDTWPNAVERTKAARIVVAALVHAATRYPELKTFVPRRPVDARNCFACDGTGELDYPLGRPVSMDKCINCCGLGWDLSDA